MANDQDSESVDRQSDDGCVIVGYTAELRADAREGVLDPKLRGERPETQVKNREKDWAAWTEVAPYSKATGHITRIVAMIPEFKVAMDTADLSFEGVLNPKNPSQAFVQWLLSFYPKAFSYRAAGAHNGVNFFGFKVKELVRVLGMEAADAGITVPLSLWYANDQCYDPAEMLVENDWRDQTPISKLLRRVGLDFPASYVVRRDARTDCLVAGELVQRYRIVPPEKFGGGLRELLETAAQPKAPAPTGAAKETVSAATDPDVPPKKKRR